MRLCDCGYGSSDQRERCCKCGRLFAAPHGWPRVWLVVYHVTNNDALHYQMYLPGNSANEALEAFRRERPSGRTVDSVEEIAANS